MYHLFFQALLAVAAVAEVQDDNKGYYALHTAVRYLDLYLSLSLSCTLFSLFDLNVHLVLLYATEEKEVLFQLHTQTTGFLLLILLYLKLHSWRNPLPWSLPGQGMPSLVEQHSVRKPSRHDNKTLHVKCCFSTRFFLYLLKFTSAPVKGPMAVELLLQSEYFHDQSW